MNAPSFLLALQPLKPVLTALLLPPVPLLLCVLAGVAILRKQPRLGWTIVALGLAALWLSVCSAPSRWLESRLLDVPPALSAARIRELQQAARTDPAHGHLAVIVLGGGRERFAPEYGEPSLEWPSLERLRYGIRLARAVGIPVGFSGGVGWAQSDEQPEAQIAARIAEQEFMTPLRWREDTSRDTRENAARTVPLLERDDVRQVLLVTHGWHMPRALRAFRTAASAGLRIEPAPMGLAPPNEGPLLDWMPSSKGATHARRVIREWIGMLAGA